MNDDFCDLVCEGGGVVGRFGVPDCFGMHVFCSGTACQCGTDGRRSHLRRTRNLVFDADGGHGRNCYSCSFSWNLLAFSTAQESDGVKRRQNHDPCMQFALDER